MSTDPCTEECIQKGLDNLTLLFKNIGANLVKEGIIALGDAIYLENVYKTFTCYLPPDIIMKIETDINSIISQSSNVVGQVNLLYIITIYVTMLALVIYLTLFFNDYIYVFLFLSIMTLIIGALVLYFGLNYIYSNASTLVGTRINHTIKLLKNAKKRALCCAGCLGNQCGDLHSNTCPQANII